MNLLFDFDGTLIDSFDCLIDKFNGFAEEYNFRFVKKEEILDLKNFNSKELIKALNIPFYKLPLILKRVKYELKNDISRLKPFHGIPDLLQKLYGSGISLRILTSNSANNVAEWLKQNNINDFFTHIYSDVGFFNKKKALKTILKTNRLEKSNTFYIGDETRDIEAAGHCKIISIAVTWGFNSEKILLKYCPNYIAREPENILSIVKTYNNISTS